LSPDLIQDTPDRAFRADPGSSSLTPLVTSGWPGPRPVINEGEPSMFGTRAARLRTAGGAVAVLASSFALFGVAGLAKADTGLPSVYCYKNPIGTSSSERIYVSNLVRTGPDANGARGLTYRTETQYWADSLHAYVNATGVFTPWTVNSISQDTLDRVMSTADIECTELLKNDFAYGQR
jgi:hypothetical protein